ncbi:MAG: hypothetical protein K2M94_07605, partial [Paramuribaculum sp.]|nr:hypothetical protein [Paramuribaculum sp.]
MEITVSLHYITAPGEKIYIVSPLLSDNRMELKDSGDGYKSATLSLPDAGTHLSYHFETVDMTGNIRHEWHGERHLNLDSGISCLHIHDNWRERPVDAPLFSSAFTKSIAARPKTTPLPAITEGTLTMEVMATMIPTGKTLAITGNCKLLGNWNPQNALALNDADYP